MPNAVSRVRASFFVYAFVTAILTQVSPVLAADGSGSEGAFTYVLVGGVAVATLVAMLMIRTALSNSTWSLSDALSEEAEVTPVDNTGKPLFVDSGGKPQTIFQMRASTSRFIAMFGLISILMMYIGFGLVLIKDLASRESLSDESQFKSVTIFLYSGATMFAPYIINKFSSVFDWLKPK